MTPLPKCVMIALVSSCEGAKMGRSELPEGVPPTNKVLAKVLAKTLADENSVNEKSNFAAPDMASPAFLSSTQPGSKANSIPGQADFAAQTANGEMTREGNRGAGRSSKIQPTQIIIMIVLAGLLTALAAVIFANARAPMPLCSEQPSWNQHNCRAG